MSGVNVPEYNAAIESSCEDSVGVPVARPYHFAVSVSHSRENRQRDRPAKNRFYVTRSLHPYSAEALRDGRQSISYSGLWQKWVHHVGRVNGRQTLPCAQVPNLTFIRSSSPTFTVQSSLPLINVEGF